MKHAKQKTLFVIVIAFILCFCYTYFSALGHFEPIPSSSLGMSYEDFVFFTAFVSLSVILLTPLVYGLRGVNSMIEFRRKLIVIGLLFQIILHVCRFVIIDWFVCQWTTCENSLFNMVVSIFILWVPSILYILILLCVIYCSCRPLKYQWK